MFQALAPFCQLPFLLMVFHPPDQLLHVPDNPAALCHCLTCRALCLHELCLRLGVLFSSNGVGVPADRIRGDADGSNVGCLEVDRSSCWMPHKESRSPKEFSSPIFLFIVFRHIWVFAPQMHRLLRAY